MPYTHEGWEWECPAIVLSVIDGATFLADVDLGWNVHVRTYVMCEGLVAESVDTPNGLAAKKEAQRLLKDAPVILRCRKLMGSARVPSQAAVCEVTYSPYHTPRSEQASFAAAMLATGLVRWTDE